MQNSKPATTPRVARTATRQQPAKLATKLTSKQISLAAKRIDELSYVASLSKQAAKDQPRRERHAVAVEHADKINRMIDAPTPKGIAEIAVFLKPHLGGLCTNCDPDTLLAAALGELRHQRKQAMQRAQELVDEAAVAKSTQRSGPALAFSQG